ncbi:hypothetical protein CALCODRAFT_495930 [Calocera cornea HHB12733]|uniref:Transmembrane protein n=1 Tax=Calocera cornea HHB12733 TaxID=1353952 RepID=A0A165G7A3_9BASI|nr:hypothetical protein CALCODRAFT_495930 [Calocera cornea HHB12733]
MSLTFQPYNLTLPSFSPVFTYLPFRDGAVSQGWNSSYTDYTVTSAILNEAQEATGYMRGVGTAYRTTAFDGASVILNFTGSAIYFCFSTEAQYTFTLDGQTVTTTGHIPDDACAGYGSHVQQMSVATGLQQNATHSATLQGSGALSFFGATVTMNAGQPGPKKTHIIDTTDPGWSWEGIWVVETDDTYMWNGVYRSGGIYSPSTVASYTFSGASAIILRGLSMFNYGPYTITLDGTETSGFNASDLWWRHSETVLYFASGLDPSVSHTVAVTNYDPNNPNPVPVGPAGAIQASVGTLTLIMDDTATRDAVLSASPVPAPSTSSGVSVSTIVAAVLGGLLLLMLGVNGFLIYAWRRLRMEMLSMRYDTNMAMEKDVLPPVPMPYALGAQQPSSVALLSAESSSQTSSAPTPHTSSYMVNVQPRPEKRAPRTVTNRNSVELRAMLPNDDVGQVGNENLQRAATGSGTVYPRSQSDTRSVGSTPALGELVTGLSALLNTHLHQEYVQRENQHSAGMDIPPEYRND